MCIIAHHYIILTVLELLSELINDILTPLREGPFKNPSLILCFCVCTAFLVTKKEISNYIVLELKFNLSLNAAEPEQIVKRKIRHLISYLSQQNHQHQIDICKVLMLCLGDRAHLLE